MRRTPDELAKMRRAGRVVAEMHAACREAAKPGVTTLDVDRVARGVLERRGAVTLDVTYISAITGMALFSRRLTVLPNSAGEEQRFRWEPPVED